MTRCTDDEQRSSARSVDRVGQFVRACDRCGAGMSTSTRRAERGRPSARRAPTPVNMTQDALGAAATTASAARSLVARVRKQRARSRKRASVAHAHTRRASLGALRQPAAQRCMSTPLGASAGAATGPALSRVRNSFAKKLHELVVTESKINATVRAAARLLRVIIVPPTRLRTCFRRSRFRA